jgi:hypothetical protein
MNKFPTEYRHHAYAYDKMWKMEEEDVHFDPRLRRNIKVNYFWGEAKSGKTRRAVDEMTTKEDENSGWRSSRLMVQQRGNGWMDGYHGEELLLIDETRPGSLDYP